jgi:elongation factor Ts
MAVTAAQIKELRDRTGVGMAKCKEALVECGGDIENAIEFLRKAGIASAVKKESRDAKEGVIGYARGQGILALIEVNAETDFVTSNQVFRDFLADAAQVAAKEGIDNVETLLEKGSSVDPSLSLEEARAVAIQKTGENIQVRRVALLPIEANQSVGVYAHMGGSIVAAVVLAGADDQEDLARDVAMHAAAAHPEYLNPDSVPADIVEKEREIAREQMAGKPDHVIDKILEGKVRSFYEGVCLVKQSFIKDESQTVEEVVSQKGKDLGKELAVASFTRWSVGN